MLNGVGARQVQGNLKTKSWKFKPRPETNTKYWLDWITKGFYHTLGKLQWKHLCFYKSTQEHTVLTMPLREERVVLHNKVYSANRVWKDARARELAGLTLTMIQATMFKVTEDVSCCTNKCMQAIEALYFLRDVVQTFL